jgi:DNA-binding IclR family transcriptional regulator
MPRKPTTPSVADDHAAPGGAAAVDRALSLLAAFRSGDGPLALAELAARTQLYKSTALRLLASLVHARLLHRQDDGRYTLGVEVARLHGVYQRQFSLGDVVLPVLRQLVDTTGESAAYHVLQGQPPHASRLCLYRVDSPHPVRDHIKAGDVLPADRGAGALILVAYTPLPSSDGITISLKNDPVSVRIRADGYFSGVGQRLPDVAGVSAPVFGADGRIAGAITLTLPAHRHDPSHITPVVAAAQALTATLTGSLSANRNTPRAHGQVQQTAAH